MHDILAGRIELRLSRLAADGVLNGKTIAVFGSYDTVGTISGVLNKLRLKISFVLNNDPGMKPTQGLPVYLPEKILTPIINNAVILIASAYYDEMRLQLEGMGYIENVHIYNLDEGMKLLKESLSRDFSEIEKLSRRGFELYKRFLRQYGEQATICVCSHTHIGDIFNLFLDIRREGISDCVLVVQTKAPLPIAELLGMENVYIAEQIEIEGLNCIHRWFCMMGEPLKIRTQASPIYEWTVTKSAFKNFTPRTDAVTYERPRIPAREMEGLFKGNGLKKGKTVLIAPSAQSHQLLPVCVWELIVEELLDRGYTVCLNSALRQDVAVIRGATPVSPPLDSIIQFAEYAGYFLGVRSGLCDILNMADCRRVVLYTPVSLQDADGFPTFFDTLRTRRYEFERGGDSLEQLYELDCVNRTEEEIIAEVIAALEERK